MGARTQAMSKNGQRCLPRKAYSTAIPFDVFASTRSLNAGQCALGAAEWPESALGVAPSVSTTPQRWEPRRRENTVTTKAAPGAARMRANTGRVYHSAGSAWRYAW